MAIAAAVLALGCSSRNVTVWRPKNLSTATAPEKNELLDVLDQPRQVVRFLVPTGRPDEFRWVEMEK